MKKEGNLPRKFDSLSEFHRVSGLPKPLHPLISFIDLDNTEVLLDKSFKSFMINAYQIAYKSNLCGKPAYGQHYYDFNEGGMIFIAPNQIIETPDDDIGSGYIVLIHPDFFLTYPIAKKIKQYGFFSYATNEALHLSDKERTTIFSIFKIIDDELESKIDDFSQDVIISQIELLLTYAHRFYKRQFITRKAVTNNLLQQMEELLDSYFNSEKALNQGIPTVQFFAEQLNLSPGYLSDLLRSLTGQNAQQHIHRKIIEKAKELLSTSNLTVSEVAYQLGFEHRQSFSKLFKMKSKLSPLDFKQTFN